MKYSKISKSTSYFHYLLICQLFSQLIVICHVSWFVVFDQLILKWLLRKVLQSSGSALRKSACTF